MLAPWIIEHFPPHRVYVEPFGGAASVLLSKPRSYGEVYNDLDGEVVNLFRVARDRGRELRRALALTPFSRDDYVRALDERPSDPFEVARLMVVRCFMGFGSNANNRSVRSGFRANANRSGTTPAHDWTNLPHAYRSIVRRLQGVVVENKPAAAIIEQQDSAETLFYCDPPYVHASRAMDKMHGHHGYAHEMTDAQHEELAAVLRSVRGMVVLSGYRSDLYARLYGDWRSVEREALADGAAPRVEVLWFNAAAWDALHRRDAPLFWRAEA
jgi:DNA adenine methylase